MAREGYREDLAALRRSVLDLGDDVLAQLDDGIDALVEGDAALGESVAEGDAAINERYLALESDCIDLFALQQPVASDLRFVAASFKISTDLERVGDLAANLGSYARGGKRRGDAAGDRHDAVGSRLDTAEVRAIGDETVALLETALDACEHDDADACRRVAERDDEVDTLCQRAGERVVRDLIGEEVAAGDAWGAEALLDDVSRVLLTVRDLERVGDHAVNVAARTLYMVDNDPTLIY